MVIHTGSVTIEKALNNRRGRIKNVRNRVSISNCRHFEIQVDNMSCVMRKPLFCIRENKGADQLRGNRAINQRLCFRYIPLLPNHLAICCGCTSRFVSALVENLEDRLHRRQVFSWRGSRSSTALAYQTVAYSMLWDSVCIHVLLR